MARPVTLFSGQWADLPLETLCKKVSEWGFDGLELACWGDHFEVDKALEDDAYIPAKRELLEKYNLKCFAISTHLVGQCVADDPIDERHKSILPGRIWGDGDPEKIVMACAMDPLTSACLTPKEIRDMACDLLEAEKQWLPQFEGKRIKPTPTIVIPKDVKHAHVPIDPALAIFARFGELAQ